ncbi:MAG: hypothetical protein HQK57_16285 [Deltaproteobacteria bacterium]|nr:hypothetical protein [Deltaproteobacteria bacterium]MBF0496778.1 hypothetical protein [Deltaproteobacteria bacterium]MBF0507764.1 hypothetical protein [Deltaproteobacteria bacterium]MBF0510467.1 hypothetical protein [Deltaproteobacteria bacterium]MBF0526486.1 hypothetical protein [Deltaproteobacteria bacterium]
MDRLTYPGAISLNQAHIPHQGCSDCIWFEWDERQSLCLKRSHIICPIHASEVFGHLSLRQEIRK